MKQNTKLSVLLALILLFVLRGEDFYEIFIIEFENGWKIRLLESDVCWQWLVVSGASAAGIVREGRSKTLRGAAPHEHTSIKEGMP